MNINYGKYTQIIKLQLDETEDKLWDNAFKMVSIHTGKPIDEIKKLKKKEFMKLYTTLTEEMKSVILTSKPIKSFEFQGKEYLVDGSITDGNVTFLSDYDSVNKLYNTKDKDYELIKHIAAMTIYENHKGLDEYSTARYMNSLILIDRLPPEIPIGIANFFLQLWNLYSKSIQECSLAQNMMKTQELILTEQQKHLTKSSQDVSNT